MLMGFDIAEINHVEEIIFSKESNYLDCPKSLPMKIVQLGPKLKASAQVLAQSGTLPTTHHHPPPHLTSRHAIGQVGG